MKISNEQVFELLYLKLCALQKLANERLQKNEIWSSDERKVNAETFANKLEQLIICLEVIENFELLEKEYYEELLGSAYTIVKEVDNRYCGLSWISYKDEDERMQEGWFAWVAPIEII